MRIRNCSCCKKELTTKTAIKIGRQEWPNRGVLVMFNCPECKSTFSGWSLFRKTESLKRTA